MKKRTILFIVLLLSTAMLLPALDWGGSITDSTGFQSVSESSDDDALTQVNRLTLYLTSPLWGANLVTLQGAVKVSRDPLFAADIEKAFLSKTVLISDRALLSYRRRIGRFLLSDPTGQVLGQVIDGVSYDFGYTNVSISLAGGYTGFVNKEFAGLTMSKLDGIDDGDDDVLLAPPRAVGQFTMSWPELVAGQSLTVAAVIQEDLRDPDEVIEEGTAVSGDTASSGGLVDTQYAILRVDGAIAPVPNLYYNTTYILNTGRTLSTVDDVDLGSIYSYEPILAHLFRVQAQYFLPELFDSRVSASVTWTSGDEDVTSYIEGNTEGKATQFLAVTPKTASSVFELQSGNSTVAAVSFSSQPFADLGIDFLRTTQTEVSLYSFFRSVGSGPVSSGDIDADTDEAYLGSEIDVNARFRPFSDFGFGLAGGLFFGNESVLIDDDSVDFLVRLSASLSF